MLQEKTANCSEKDGVSQYSEYSQVKVSILLKEKTAGRKMRLVSVKIFLADRMRGDITLTHTIIIVIIIGIIIITILILIIGLIIIIIIFIITELQNVRDISV